MKGKSSERARDDILFHISPFYRLPISLQHSAATTFAAINFNPLLHLCNVYKDGEAQQACIEQLLLLDSIQGPVIDIRQYHMPISYHEDFVIS